MVEMSALPWIAFWRLRPSSDRRVWQISCDTLYLKGKYFWNKRTLEDLEGAIEQLRQVEAAEPTFRSAHTYLSYIYLHSKDCRVFLSESRKAAIGA
jgi:hypothetical protein